MSLKEYMQENRGRIDALLESHINNLPDSVEPKLKAAMRHGLLLGGKGASARSWSSLRESS